MLGFTQPHLDDLPLSEALASGQKMSNLMALCLKPVAVCKLPILKDVFNHLQYWCCCRLDASAGLLTNFEVLEVLKERGTRTEADESGVPGPATPSEQKV